MIFRICILIWRILRRILVNWTNVMLMVRMMLMKLTQYLMVVSAKKSAS